MHADSAYVIGATHEVCQDYALTGNTERGAFGIVCDGCSSSPDTDVGARLLALAVKNGLCAWPDDEPGFDFSLIAQQAPLALMTLGHDRLEALDATLLVVRAVEKSYEIVVYGDGASAALDHDDDVNAVITTSVSGAPPYLSYCFNSKRKQAYVDARLGEIRNDIADGSCWVTPGEPSYTRSGERSYKALAVFSDGVSSFRDANGDAVDPHIIIHELMTFKTTAGAFVRRRMRGFLRTCKELGWVHTDDLAMAAIFLGYES